MLQTFALHASNHHCLLIHYWFFIFHFSVLANPLVWDWGLVVVSVLIFIISTALAAWRQYRPLQNALFLIIMLSVRYLFLIFLYPGWRYKAAMIEDVPRIFEAVFQCTLEVSMEVVNRCSRLCGFYMWYFLSTHHLSFRCILQQHLRTNFLHYILMFNGKLWNGQW
jgi:hypothetical protein